MDVLKLKQYPSPEKEHHTKKVKLWEEKLSKEIYGVETGREDEVKITKAGNLYYEVAH